MEEDGEEEPPAGDGQGGVLLHVLPPQTVLVKYACQEEGREINLDGGEVRRFRGAASALFGKCRGRLLQQHS